MNSQTVRPRLEGPGIAREEIGYAIRGFIDGDRVPVFWGYFPAYDWVAFSWLFGRMDQLPFHFPQLCLDIKQLAIELGDPELPHQSGARHHALADARWTRDAWRFLVGLAPSAGERRPTGGKNEIPTTSGLASNAAFFIQRGQNDGPRCLETISADQSPRQGTRAQVAACERPIPILRPTCAAF